MKSPFSAGYVVNPAGATFANAGCFALNNGGAPFLDFAILAAANINYDQTSQQAVLWLNPQMSTTLQSTNAVKSLQAQGIKVLLCVLNNWQNAGWSCFANQPSAQAFAAQLANCVETYGLDGIDIDDEYDSCVAPGNPVSMIMVTSALRALRPDIIITKALFEDSTYFQATWQGMTLAQQLSYGWEMSYNTGGPDQRLAPYVGWGMQKNQLALGVQPQDGDPTSLAQQVASEEYGGMMLYTVNGNDQTTVDCINSISTAFYGNGASVTAGCWTSGEDDMLVDDDVTEGDTD